MRNFFITLLHYVTLLTLFYIIKMQICWLILISLSIQICKERSYAEPAILGLLPLPTVENVFFPAVPPVLSPILFSQYSLPFSDRLRTQKENLVLATPNSTHSFGPEKETSNIPLLLRPFLRNQWGWWYIPTYTYM